MSCNISEALELVLQNRSIWNEVELQPFGKLTPEPIKGESKCIQGKLKTWKECIKTNFLSICPIQHVLQCNSNVMNRKKDFLNLLEGYKK